MLFRKQHVVIGSGPAGVSAAHALLARGLSVTMLDVGIELDPLRQNLLDALKLNWDQEKYATLKHAKPNKQNIKLSYGSEYSYQIEFNQSKLIFDKNVQCTPSFAQGGLSTVWGAYAAPYDENDLVGWPIRYTTLQPYFEKINVLLPITKNYLHSEQAIVLLKNFHTHETTLRDAGFQLFSPSLAVFFSGKPDAPSCFYCGNCQHGCPNSLIYSAKDTLRDLLKNKNFTYIKNVMVEKIKEQGDRIIIFAHHMNQDCAAIEIIANRVFLAAGAVFSTKILLHSLGLFEHSVTLKDSQHFLLPCLMRKIKSNPEKETLHTLTQLVLHLHHSKISNHRIHLQLYTYMDHYWSQLKSMLKISYPFLKPALAPFINRLIVMQGYFHSDESSACTVMLSKDTKTLALEREKKERNVILQNKITLLSQYLKTHEKQFGFFPLRCLAKSSRTLGSNHYGGSFPMELNPRTLISTDLLGRPAGMKKLHVVDATIFPTIPAQSITMTVMANAYRIAMECPI